MKALNIRIRHSLAALGALLLPMSLGLTSCEDDTSVIGSGLATGEVNIMIDSITTKVPSTAVYYDSFDARTISKLLGRINVPEYGSLSASFVTQLLSAQKMNIPDSIPLSDVDSMRLVLTAPTSAITGDSLAPQQLKVYRLTKQLPSDISSTFDPKGYYSQASLLGQRSYTLSNIHRGDSAMKADSYVRVPIQMPMELCREIFQKYRAGDPVFEWPASFNEYFPGLYVEQTFGNGCLANITGVEMYTYWHRTSQYYTKLEDGTYGYVNTVKRDSVCLFASQPEVLSSNVINYNVSDYIKGLVARGERILTTPGGYMVDVQFPVRELVEKYQNSGNALSMVSSLKFEIPATVVVNSHDIALCPYLLMVKKSEREAFFRENKVPDGITSFYAAYDSESGTYHFNGMRSYFLKVLEDLENGKQIDGEAAEFTLVPVSVTTETVNNYTSSYEMVTRCAPYIAYPTMTRLYMDRCAIVFTYSTQELR